MRDGSAGTPPATPNVRVSRQLEREPRAERRQERRATAEHDRADERLVLVHQVELHEAGRQAGTADGDVLPRLCLQRGELLLGAADGQPSVALDPLEGAGEHDLRHVLPDARELILVVRALRPLVVRVPVAHHLVQPASAELDARLPHPLVVEAVQLLVRRRPVDLPARPGDEAVERHRHRVDQLPHPAEELFHETVELARRLELRRVARALDDRHARPAGRVLGLSGGQHRSCAPQTISSGISAASSSCATERD